MANRSVRLLMLGESLRIKNDQMKCCITRAASGFLVQRNIQAAQRYLKDIQATLDEMSHLDDSRVSEEQERKLVEMGCCEKN